jgi:hypothetical protein
MTSKTLIALLANSTCEAVKELLQSIIHSVVGLPHFMYCQLTISTVSLPSPTAHGVIALIIMHHMNKLLFLLR